VKAEWLLDMYFDWDKGLAGVSAKEGRFDHVHSDSGSVGVVVNEVPLATIVHRLMSTPDDLRAALLDAIGLDAVKEHFGLIELAEPGDLR
jgi:hypothetical protein